MSKIHILEKSPDGHYKLAIHVPTPTGSNSANVTWKDALLGSLPVDAAGKKLFSILPKGDSAGEVDASELLQLTSGDLVELVEDILVESGGTTETQVDAIVDKAIDARVVVEKARLKFYGHTQG